MSTTIEALATSQPQLSSEGGIEGATITLMLAGEPGLDAGDPLARLLDVLHSEAIARKVTTAVVDLRRLEFLTSTGMKRFITWIRRVGELDLSARYTIHFVYSPQIPWQRRSLHALRCFAPDLITVEG
jgi:hypothetical protein